MFSLVKTISNKALKHSINVMQETQSAILSLNARDLHIYAFFFCISYTKLLEFFFNGMFMFCLYFFSLGFSFFAIFFVSFCFGLSFMRLINALYFNNKY